MAASAISQSIRIVWAQVHSPAGLPFPQTVAALLALGVTRYHVDYLAATNAAYISNSATGAIDVDVAPVPSHVPKSGVGAAWNAEGVQVAIRKAQAGMVSYAEFSRECIEAGVTNYMSCLEGKRVVYLGAMGDLHVEWFPGAKPKE